MGMCSWLERGIGVSKCLRCMGLRVLVEAMASDDGSLCCREQASIGAGGWILSAQNLLSYVLSDIPLSTRARLLIPTCTRGRASGTASGW